MIAYDYVQTEWQVRYISGPDDIYIKKFHTQAVGSDAAKQHCLDERDVYQIISVGPSMAGTPVG